jgi:hypothetical protein
LATDHIVAGADVVVDYRHCALALVIVLAAASESYNVRNSARGIIAGPPPFLQQRNGLSLPSQPVRELPRSHYPLGPGQTHQLTHVKVGSSGLHY